MSMRCEWCSSTDTQAGFDLIQCLSCGQHSTFTGERAVATSLTSEGVTVADVEAETGFTVAAKADKGKK